ncbi:MAG: recombination mediator RecR [Candidatus Sumerlaeaceae bacterium]|nr:recombination mediator RecR [Candidatus Sumerlaeaceae bacterium]
MTAILPESLEKLIEQLSRLPTIGRKTAQRLAFFIIQHSPPMAEELAGAISRAGARVRPCRQCFFLAEEDVCAICKAPQRDASVLCIVEESFDVVAFERTGTFRGLYHVLQGKISPLHGVMPESLTIAPLLERMRNAVPPIREVILATSPTVDGDATALYLAEKLRPFGCRMTRIGVGVAIGSSLELADELTLKHALERRQEIS